MPLDRTRLARWGKRAAKIGVVAVVLLGIGLFFTLEYTSTPRFCITCHYMKPYYEAWATSKHSKVPCGECHYAPGAQGYFQSKFQALSQVAKYVTRTYGTKPWAEISDANCLRSGCHDKRLLRGQVVFKSILFDHRPHLTSLKRGKKLRCTSCHSQIVQGSHISVTTSTCFLCHFKNMPPGQPLGGCPSCHGAPKQAVNYQGIQFEHKEILERGISCQQCHAEVTRGDGDVPKDRCASCHSEEDRLKRYGDIEFIHKNHVTNHKVECQQCHNEIQHGRVQMSSAIAVDCQTCHPDHHAAQKGMYMGVGGRGAPEQPSSMFLASVSCRGCHLVHKGQDLTGVTLQAGEAGCMSCHNEKYGKILAQWKEAMSQALARMLPALEHARSEVAGAKARGRVTIKAEDFLTDASYNIELVRYGRGVHNMEYAQGLMNTASSQISQAMQEIGSSYRPPVLSMPQGKLGESPCFKCHTGVENRSGTIFGLSFEHRRHLLQAGLACDRCHGNSTEPTQPGHGKKPSDRAACLSCHHAKKGEKQPDCARCHPTQVTMNSGGELAGVKGQPGPMGGKLTCDQCHAELEKGHSREKVRSACVDCHSKDYGETLDNWQSGTKENLTKAKELLKSAKAAVSAKEKSGQDVPALKQGLLKAQKMIFAVEADGTMGGHNPEFADALLSAAQKELEAIKP